MVETFHLMPHYTPHCSFIALIGICALSPVTNAAETAPAKVRAH